MQVQDLVFVKEGCVFWVTIGNHAILKTCPRLFTAEPKNGFVLCYTVVLLYMLYCYTVICDIRVYELSLGCYSVVYCTYHPVAYRGGGLGFSNPPPEIPKF